MLETTSAFERFLVKITGRSSNDSDLTIICTNKSIMSYVDNVRLVTRNVWATLVRIRSGGRCYSVLKIIKPTKNRLTCRVTAARFSYWVPVTSCEEDKWVNRKKSKPVRRSWHVEEDGDRLVGRKIIVYGLHNAVSLEFYPYGGSALTLMIRMM